MLLALLLAAALASDAEVVCNSPHCTACPDGTCTSCDEGYFVTPAGLCYAKSDIAGCKTFDNAGCTECKKKFVKMSPFSCVPCEDFFLNCDECNSTQCTKCSSGELEAANITGVPSVKFVCGAASLVTLAVIVFALIL